MDAERAVVDWLNAADLGWKAYYDVPAKRPGAFAVVERTGGARGELVAETPMLDVQLWAKSRRDAALMADAASDAMARMPDGLDGCFHVSVTSTFRDTDLESGTPRYHVVVEITFNK